MMRSLWILPLLFALPLQAAQQIHKWVDDKGVVHFSDRLSEGAQDDNVQMTIIDTATGTEKNSANSGTIESNPVNDAALEAVASFTLGISSPTNGETVRENSGLVKIQATLNPQPTTPYILKVLLDDTEAGSFNNTLQAELNNVERGMHKLEVQAIDQSGKILASSTPVTFYLFRVSAISAAKAK